VLEGGAHALTCVPAEVFSGGRSTASLCGLFCYLRWCAAQPGLNVRTSEKDVRQGSGLPWLCGDPTCTSLSPSWTPLTCCPSRYGVGPPTSMASSRHCAVACGSCTSPRRRFRSPTAAVPAPQDLGAHGPAAALRARETRAVAGRSLFAPGANETPPSYWCCCGTLLCASAVTSTRLERHRLGGRRG
jgi:hypothetical protein